MLKLINNTKNQKRKHQRSDRRPRDDVEDTYNIDSNLHVILILRKVY